MSADTAPRAWRNWRERVSTGRARRSLCDGVVVGEARQLLQQLAGPSEEEDGGILEDAVGLRERGRGVLVEDVDAYETGVRLARAELGLGDRVGVDLRLRVVEHDD